MTDYVPYTPDEYAPDAPGTALHFQRWFENWIAGFEGAAGAPRLLLAAIERLRPGTSIRVRNDAVASIPGAQVTFGTVFSVNVAQAGTVQIAWEHRRIANQTMETRVLRTRAGTTVQIGTTQGTTSTSFVALTEDVDVQPGDIVLLQSRMNTSSSGGEIRNRRLQVDPATYLWPAEGLYGLVEGNPALT
ncbi:MAG: hypothetical protein J0L76_05295 [Rhodobacterales bacterium]|nr:hypothetical protein [Rhodobacterales bacterium]